MHWTALEDMADASGYQVGHSARTIHRRRDKLERFLPQSEGGSFCRGKWFTDAGELQRAFDHWRTVYNLERPHDAQVPASRYQPSARQFRTILEPPEYDEVVVRKVDIRVNWV